jgi:hypothetical protein
LGEQVKQMSLLTLLVNLSGLFILVIMIIFSVVPIQYVTGKYSNGRTDSIHPPIQYNTNKPHTEGSKQSD